MPNKRKIVSGYHWKEVMWKLSDGTPLIQFCQKNNIKYCTALKYIREGKNVDEACQMALERRGKKDNNTRYWIDGKSLRQYCKENGVKYEKMRLEIIKRQQLWKEITNAESI